jgi:hypothetical protein
MPNVAETFPGDVDTFEKYNLGARINCRANLQVNILGA